MSASTDLEHIESLRNAGAITDIEYSRARLQILDGIAEQDPSLSPESGRRRTRIKQLMALGLFASCILLNLDAVMVTLLYLGLGALVCAAFVYLLSGEQK